ncbi:sterol desaturase family protein [Cesiribacter andamanensis]|uniref:Fatty acid hydroxylase superfamily protein n=1 Tax=Cesiribacter andamanensis AMV16 TaxID=1279009 RepID=M7N3K2_9BACT|nr:sterol desaturase family protein [Cesiribacter andamanensis]EMR01776.1 Fatty acid hydroxylase superfamily protein [Cesiribacter andamanensis AMV16]
MKVVLMAIGAFAGMEAISWCIHKYIMHGPLWKIHRTHHVHGKGFFELNDLFSLFFGSTAIVLLIVGLNRENPYATGAGLGISVYGMLYFILHDMIIHRRIKAFGTIKNRYLRGLAAAHRDHHRSRERDGGVAFGLLWVPVHYFKQSNLRKGGKGEPLFHKRSGTFVGH